MNKGNRAGGAANPRRPSRPDTSPSPGTPPAGHTASTEANPQLAALKTLHALYGAIADLGAALHLTPTRLADGEALDRLEVVTRLGVEQPGGWESARVEGWFATLGDDLALDLRLEGLDPDLPSVAASLRAGGDPAGALRAFQVGARSAAETQDEDISVEARLSLGKVRAQALARQLVAHRSGTSAPTDVAVFYLAATWNQLLSLGNLPALEQAGLSQTDCRTCVLLCDASGYLAGVVLECVGVALADSPEWLAVSSAAFRQFVAREADIRRLLAEEGGWPDAPRMVIGERLRLTARVPGLEQTAERLATFRAELAAATLASSVQGNLADALTLRFAGVRPASCALTGHGERALPTDTGEALSRLADWATRHGAVDTLIIARECLARELPPGRELPLAEVAGASLAALEAAKANFTLFVRGQTDRYFAARQTAQDAVAEYAGTVRRAVSDLTSDVVDDVYRTVGLLAAVVIAGLIQPAISPLLALLASILYAGYIGFILLLPLRARDDRFSLEGSALTARLGEMSELTTTERQRIQQPASAADAYYRRYMRRARLTYLILLALGVVFALVFLIIALAHR